jgi:hypothetical protein
MTDLLRLIRRRRKAINYFHKTAEIDNAVRNKVEALYRRCTHRFQERLDIWMKRLEFAKWAKMRAVVSKVYSSVLKVRMFIFIFLYQLITEVFIRGDQIGAYGVPWKR